MNMTDAKQAAQALVEALETLTRISEEQSRELERSRRRMESLRSAFSDRVASREHREAQVSEDVEELVRDAENLSSEHERHMLREMSIADSYGALMRLYAHPPARASADRIADLLREIRRIDVGDDPTEFSTRIGSIGLPETSREVGPEAARAGIFEHHLRMGDVIGSQQARWDELIARSDALLAEALHEARGLLAEL